MLEGLETKKNFSVGDIWRFWEEMGYELARDAIRILDLLLEEPRENSHAMAADNVNLSVT